MTQRARTNVEEQIEILNILLRSRRLGWMGPRDTSDEGKTLHTILVPEKALLQWIKLLVPKGTEEKWTEEDEDADG